MQGEIKGLGDKGLKIAYFNKNERDTVSLKSAADKFIWTALMAEPQKITLIIDEAKLQLYVEAATINLNATLGPNLQRDLKVTGSKSFDRAVDYQQKLREALTPNQNDLIQVTAGRSKNTPEDIAVRYRNSYAKVVQEFVNEYPDEPISLDAVMNLSNFGSYEITIPAFEKLSVKLKANPDGISLTQRMNQLKRKRVGETMIDFDAEDNTGKMVNFMNSIKNSKYTFVDIWASWCGPCRAESPNILKAYNYYKEKGFNVLGISIDADLQAWRNAIKDDGLPWLQLTDQKREITMYYGVVAIPSTLLIDAKGNILAVDLRGEALHKKLADLMH